jgi:hypothetical protein
VLLVPAAPVGIVGLVALVSLRRTPAFREPGPLRALVLGGLLTFLVTSIVFPVATLWGTFQHASGPLHVALIVSSELVLDALVARVRSWRGWSRENAWLAPLATLGLSVPVAILSIALVAHGATAEAQRMESLRRGVPTLDGPVITDHPMWVSLALSVPAIALPREDDAALKRLAAAFDTPWLLLLDNGLTGPSPADPCFEPVNFAMAEARLYQIQPGCGP